MLHDIVYALKFEYDMGLQETDRYLLVAGGAKTRLGTFFWSPSHEVLPQSHEHTYVSSEGVVCVYLPSNPPEQATQTVSTSVGYRCWHSEML